MIVHWLLELEIFRLSDIQSEHSTTPQGFNLNKASGLIRVSNLFVRISIMNISSISEEKKPTSPGKVGDSFCHSLVLIDSPGTLWVSCLISYTVKTCE